MNATTVRPRPRTSEVAREATGPVDPHEEVVELSDPWQVAVWMLPPAGLLVGVAAMGALLAPMALQSWTWGPAAVLALGAASAPLGALTVFEHRGLRIRLSARRLVIERLGRRVERVASLALVDLTDVRVTRDALVLVEGERRWWIPTGNEGVTKVADRLREATRRAREAAAPEDAEALAAVRALSRPESVSAAPPIARSQLLRASRMGMALAWLLATWLVATASWRELRLEQGWEPPIELTVPEVGDTLRLPSDARLRVTDACLDADDVEVGRGGVGRHALRSADHRRDPVRARVPWPEDTYLEPRCWKREVLELVVRRRAAGPQLELASAGPDTARWWSLLALLLLGPGVLTAQGALVRRVERERSVHRT
ncbi:MAG: hypothetical protein H6738_04335 [Alphaproteobacteria bacterium]|nr:hypothetical protein [Alphaproteobacteria bacterium]MCB9696000.1 hypothetical protein [Alphaproteobacteria bacterium]